MNGAFVILTAILSSGVIAALISASFTDVKERSVFRRQKIEELYLSSAKWLREAETMFLPYLRVCKGDISYNDAMDEINKRGDQAKEIGEHHLRMGMNIKMYEPSLLIAFDALEAEQKKVNQLIFAIRSHYKESGEASRFFKPYYDQIYAFGKASDALKAAIIVRGSEIASEPTQVLKIAGALRRFFVSFLVSPKQQIDQIWKRLRW